MKINNNRIYLIGYMGSGKTTIGKKLAKKLGSQFVDVDCFIESRQRKTINEIFSEKGEDAFRLMEHNALEEISLFENVIISTGGGAPCFYNNIELMNKSGFTIYLKTSPEELTKRLNINKNKRPLLRDKTPEEMQAFITENLEKRNYYYSQAQLIFDTRQMSANNIVDALILHLP
ncbi:MAG: shikimate kinase [Dysgonamonadaceae bacterium]|jgi:shikimate kinase|nr:shikimate kinase [Dysgonamonadaceae bacterium]